MKKLKSENIYLIRQAFFDCFTGMFWRYSNYIMIDNDGLTLFKKNLFIEKEYNETYRPFL